MGLVFVSRSCVAGGGARKTGARRSPRQRTNVMVRHVLFHVTAGLSKSARAEYWTRQAFVMRH